MDRGNDALRYLAHLIEYGKVLEKMSDVAAEIEKWEAIVAKSKAEAEKKLLEADKELLETEKEHLRKKMEDVGSILVDDASLIDVVESLIKDHKLVCDFYTADPEIMEEMRRRGLRFTLTLAEESDADSGLDRSPLAEEESRGWTTVECYILVLRLQSV